MVKNGISSVSFDHYFPSHDMADRYPFGISTVMSAHLPQSLSQSNSRSREAPHVYKTTLLFPLDLGDSKGNTFPLLWNNLNHWNYDFTFLGTLQPSSSKIEKNFKPSEKVALLQSENVQIQQQQMQQQQQKTECPASPGELSPAVPNSKKGHAAHEPSSDNPIMVIVSQDAQKKLKEQRQRSKKQSKKSKPIPLHLLPPETRSKIMNQTKKKSKKKKKNASNNGPKNSQRQGSESEESIEDGKAAPGPRKYSKNICNRWRQKGYCTGGRRCEFTHPPEWRAVGRK